MYLSPVRETGSIIFTLRLEHCFSCDVCKSFTEKCYVKMHLHTHSKDQLFSFDM